LLCIVIFRCFSLLFARAGTPGKSAQSRAAQGEIRRRVQRPHCYFIVINNAAVRERRAGRVAAPGKMLASILARFGAFHFTMSNSPVRRPYGSSPEDHVECEYF